MKIIQYPQNWKDLQNKVGTILRQCNFRVETEKTVTSARSEIEIDVYAEENIDNRKYLILCECKMWNTNIPQLYVHGLRTVVNDIGASKGYIISTSDFQKGAKKSIKNTNVELLNWEDFQKEFFKSWYVNYFSKELNSIVKRDYDLTAIQFFDDFTKVDKKEYYILIGKYNYLQEIANHFPSPVFQTVPSMFKEIDNKLPLSEKLMVDEWEFENVQIPKEISDECCYSDFLKLISDFAKPVYEKLDKLDLTIEYD